MDLNDQERFARTQPRTWNWDLINNLLAAMAVVGAVVLLIKLG